MTRVAGVFLFRMPGDALWVREAALGAEASSEFRGSTVHIRLPARDDDFWLGNAPGGERALAANRTTTPEGTALGVSVIEVIVYGEAPLGTNDFQGPYGREVLGLASDVLRGLLEVAETFVKHVVDQARVRLGQYWIATSTDEPQQTGVASLIDVETGNQIPISVGGYLVSPSPSFEEGVSVESWAEIVNHAAEEAENPLPESLLADARHLAWTQHPPDYRLATLLAAIACESKVKRTLAQLADPVVNDVLSLLLENPRDATMSVLSHFDKTAAAVAGRSLRQENRDLFKAVGHLFETRNRIAHGQVVRPLDDEMIGAVRAACDAFRWLDSLLDTQ